MSDEKLERHVRIDLFLEIDQATLESVMLDITEFADNYVHWRSLMPENVVGALGVSHPVGKQTCCERDDANDYEGDGSETVLSLNDSLIRKPTP